MLVGSSIKVNSAKVHITVAKVKLVCEKFDSTITRLIIGFVTAIALISFFVVSSSVSVGFSGAVAVCSLSSGPLGNHPLIRD